MDQIKKNWVVRTAGGDKEISFTPHFEVTSTSDGTSYADGNKEIECRFVDLKFKDDKGVEVEFRMNFLDLYLFTYYIANEELRQQLQLRHERQITNIPYEVTFTLSREEIEQKVAKRLITLPVDAIAMAMARSELNLLKGGKGHRAETLESYLIRKKGKMPTQGHKIL